MNREERNAYQRGYQHRAKASWPEHKPPYPPNEIMKNLFEAIRRFRDSVDAQMAMFGENDDFTISVGPKMDDLDHAMSMVGKWLLEPEIVNQPDQPNQPNGR